MRQIRQWVLNRFWGSAKPIAEIFAANAQLLALWRKEQSR